MDRLTPLRAPLTALALAVLTLVAAARVVLGLSEVVAVDGSRAVAAARLAPNGSDAALTILVGVLVAACFLGPAVPARRRFAAWGAVLTLVSLVATLVALGLTNLVVAGWNLVWSLPDLAVPVLVGIALLALARSGPTGPPVRPAPTSGEVGPGERSTAATTTDAAAPAPDPELEPSWSQDAAAGAVWRTADEAARGVPAQDWGAAGQTGWPSFRAPAALGEDVLPSAAQHPDPAVTPALPVRPHERDARPDRA